MSESLPRVLLTGFAPFGGETVNPSWDAVARLDGGVIAGHVIVSRQLPVAFGSSLPALRAALEETAPGVVICVGQAGGRAQVSIERVAINVIDARIPDNAGASPVDVPVVQDGPAAYFATLPIKAMLAEIQHAGIPAEISQTAGTYVCNQVFYGLMHALRDRPGVRGGFIHIPYSPAQAVLHASAPSVPTDMVVAALQQAIAIAVSGCGREPRQSTGTEH